VERDRIRVVCESVLGPIDDPQHLVDTVEKLMEDAGKTHSYDVPMEDFVRHLANVVDHGANEQGPSETLRGADLYLAFAAARGVKAAVADFERLLERAAPPALARLKLDPARREEVLQRARIRLAVGDGKNSPKLLSYGGRGALEAWVRVVLVRIAYNFLDERAERRDIPESDALAFAAASGSIETDVLVHQHAARLHEAVGAAMRELPPRDLAILRFYMVEDLTIDELGKIYDVDRSTAARWVRRSREKLADLVRSGFCRSAGVDESEFFSIVRALPSYLDLTVERVLAAREKTEQ
jgi:RNA polymerase sigma-70 factor (ECF subfamily)